MSTGIPYVNETWNVTAGCNHCSVGCENCWAEKWAYRLSAMGKAPYDLVQAEGLWNGNIELIKDNLDQPLHWKRPRRIFVCSMSDLFHPKVPWEYIDDAFNIIALPNRHTFLIFTKRIKRAAEYFNHRHRMAESLNKDFERDGIKERCSWPWPNVQLILSLSTQAEADEKIPILMEIPAAVRGLSIEPLLEPVDFVNGMKYSDGSDWWNGFLMDTNKGIADYLHWVIIGCESMPGLKVGRFQDGFIEAARSLVRQSQAVGVPVYMKQLPINGRVSRNPKEWPEHLRVQDYAKVT